jgi:hypothetical protein
MTAAAIPVRRGGHNGTTLRVAAVPCQGGVNRIHPLAAHPQGTDGPGRFVRGVVYYRRTIHVAYPEPFPMLSISSAMSPISRRRP